MFGVFLIVLLVALSLSVWGQIAVRWRRGLPALDPAARVSSPWLPIASGAAAVLVAVMLVYSLGALVSRPQATPDVTLSDVQWSVFDGVMHIAVALALLTAGGRIPPADCGMTSQKLGRQIRDGIRGYLACLVPVMLVLLLTSALRTPENQHPFLKLLHRDHGAVSVVWLLLTAVVVAPIKEELIFRVMLQDGLARRIGSAPAIGITSVLFCLVHGFPDSLALLPLAIILGYVYDRRQSVLSIVLIHALFNLTNILILLTESDPPL